MSNKVQEMKIDKRAYYQGGGAAEVEDTQPMPTVPEAPIAPLATPLAPPPTPVAVPTPPNPRLMDVDVLKLELAKSNRKIALATAQKALSDNEVAELNYKYLVLQIYMKYGLTEADTISENGEIVKGGALQGQTQVK